MADKTIHDLVLNNTPSAATELEVYDPTKTPKSGRTAIQTLIAKALTYFTGGSTDDILTKDSDGNAQWMPPPIIALANRAALKAFPSSTRLQLVFLLTPEDGVARCYRSVWADPATPDDIAIIGSTDGFVNYYQVPLV